jgi:hypothetical protein
MMSYFPGGANPMRKLSTFLLFLVSIFLSVASAQQKRGPSTPEERDRFVKVAAAFQADPLNKALQPDREWAILFLIEVPDISISICIEMMPWTKDKYELSGELTVAAMLAAGSFVIKNGSSDQFAVNTAGVEAALEAYRKIVAADPKKVSKRTNELLEKQKRAELAEFVRAAQKKCK